jgi:hypothetical protein
MRVRHIFLTYATIVLLCVLFHVFGSATAPPSTGSNRTQSAACARAESDCAACMAMDNCSWCTQIALHANGTLRSVAAACLPTGTACAASPAAGIRTAVNLCPRTGDLPCYGRALGDVCTVNDAVDEPLPLPLNLTASADGLLHHRFLTAGIGVRSELPQFACALLPSFLPAARWGECACRHRHSLAALAQLHCPAPSVAHIDALRAAAAARHRSPASDAICAALAAHGRCVRDTYGDACFTSDAIAACRDLDLYNLTTIACFDACAPSRHESSALVQLRPSAPVCALAGSAGACLTALSYPWARARGQICAPTPGRPEFDEQFAIHINYKFPKGAAIVEVVGGSDNTCYSYFFASSGKYQWIAAGTAASPLARAWPPIAATPLHTAQFVDIANVGALPVVPEWVVTFQLDAAGGADVNATLEQVFSVPCRFGVVLGFIDKSDAGAPLAAAITRWVHARGRFLYDQHLSEQLFTARSTLYHTKAVMAFIRRDLAAPAAFPSFLRAAPNAIPWNGRVPVMGEHIRIFTPSAIAWKGQSVVISIHSDAKYSAWRSSIRETWLPRARRVGCLPLFVVLEPTAATIAEANAYNDIIAIDAPFVYHAEQSSLPLMEHVFFQVVVRNAVDAEWAMKTDQDTMVFPDALTRFLARLRADNVDPQRDHIYAGALLQLAPVRNASARAYVSAATYAPLDFPAFMSGGAGYVISVKLARCLTLHTATQRFNYFPRSDVGMRIAMLEAGCEPLQMNASALFSPGQVPNAPADQVTMHYVKDADIPKFWLPQQKATTNM